MRPVLLFHALLVAVKAKNSTTQPSRSVNWVVLRPYAELILRGIKPIEFRSRPTKIIGERFHIYASKPHADASSFGWLLRGRVQF
jgi:hypothetical protein